MMDGRFLSNAEIAAASREFVCVRTATYESASEAEFLKTVFVDRSGNLQNTVTAILSPDGETVLSRPGRSWDWAYKSPSEMVADMKRIATKYPVKGDVKALPAMADFRISLNVAACDNLPLVVGVAETASIWARELFSNTWCFAPAASSGAIHSEAGASKSNVARTVPVTPNRPGCTT